MIYVNEAKARLAGQIAAADAITEYADMLNARDVRRMLNRVERCQHPTRRAGKAVQ